MSTSLTCEITDLLEGPSDYVAPFQFLVSRERLVRISQSKIAYSGWTGAEYTVIDPQTGGLART